jgi:5'-deoxynucleotidase YfbR-like HD superfamily hydrolase
MSYSLKNNKVYDETLNYIFSFDKNSNILTLNMIKALFEKYNLELPTDMKYFEKYYGTSQLDKNTLKQKDQSEVFSDTYIKNGLKIFSDGDKLNIDKLYQNIQILDPSIKYDYFQAYVNSDIFNFSDNSIDTFYNYVLTLLK